VSFRDDGHVFTNVQGTGPLHPNSLEYRYKRLKKQAGLPHIAFHDLRHTFATLMLKRGVPAKIVQEMLGHSSIAITLDNLQPHHPGHAVRRGGPT
jgi:integrase